MSPSALKDYSVVTKRVKKCCDREGEKKAEFLLFIKGRAWISECLIILLPHKLSQYASGIWLYIMNGVFYTFEIKVVKSFHACPFHNGTII